MVVATTTTKISTNTESGSVKPVKQGFFLVILTTNILKVRRLIKIEAKLGGKGKFTVNTFNLFSHQFLLVEGKKKGEQGVLLKKLTQ